MAESVFKKLGTIEYNNMKITGHLEYKLKPWEVIFEIETKITPFSKVDDNSDLLYDFHKWVRKNHLGKRRVFDELCNNLLPGWDLDYECGFGHSYNHSPEQLTFNNQSDYNMTLHVGAPDKPRWKQLLGEFEETTKIISSLKAFKSNDVVQFDSVPINRIAQFHIHQNGFADFVDYVAN
tara:strand:- start:3686 stop:4222 length:537 start_codon:yes stop_codon:yes gene_type:complete